MKTKNPLHCIKYRYLEWRWDRVEPAQPGDTVGHVGPIDQLVRLGR